MRISLKLLTLVALGVYATKACNTTCAVKNCVSQSTSLNSECALSTCGCDFTGKDFTSGQYAKYMNECVQEYVYPCLPYARQQDFKQYFGCLAEIYSTCSIQVVPSDFNQMTSLLSQKEGCSEQLNAKECRDVYFAYFGKDLFAKKTLLKDIHGPHKKAMKKLLDKPISLGQQYDLDIYVNETIVEDFLNDYIDFENEYIKAREEVAEQLTIDAQNAYKDLMAKMYLDWGEIYYPVVESWRKVIKTALPKDSCNRTYFVENCLRPDFTVYPPCVEQSGCMNLKKHEKAVQEYKEAKAEYDRQIQQGAQDIFSDFLPTIQKYQENQKKIQERYFELLRNQAVPVGGCDQDCVNRCTSNGKYNMFSIDKCIKWCHCNGGFVIDVNAGQVNQTMIALYSQGKENGKLYFDRFFPQE